ncbi:IPT/TIG domain-containing protein [Pedobacter arcticus]|uniref:IPT/TIG domain-containing protein n=1 Tax=Pedobacter arcticus TaxID=752140 RepID=UPI00030F6DE3|nr:IPT/TIG domain-containing protein [Pedobacter arcticus]
MIRKYINAGLVMLTFMTIVACKKDKNESTAVPTLSAVTNLTNRSANLPSIGYGEWIIITGKNLSTTFKVDFNGAIVKDSLVFANDTSITVKIPAELVDPVNNPITVTTKYGTATLNFKIMQPMPRVDDFNPAAGAPDDEVTIMGAYFKGVTNVTINGLAATILSSTKTEIKVKVPAGVSYGAVVVTTPVGVATATKTFGLKHVIYDDALRNSWTNTSYSTLGLVFNNSDVVRRGTSSILVNHKGFSALRFRLSSKFSTTGYTMLKLSMYGGVGTQGKKVKISVSPAAGSYELLLTEGKWTDYQVQLINIGTPATIEYLTFQEFSGFTSNIYVDDIGFY